MSFSELALSVRNVSKSYTICHNAVRHTTLAEAVMYRLKNPLGRQEKEIFWALNDVSFEIPKGDVVGIIGRNGAGKSTLLKILSQITEPTRGEIDLYGPVGSLLEVGTGFHPELTGRENVYLNGAILGMSRRQISRQFDAIVDFAGVEQFLDTPVKRYSSGMYIRLAFAVAAHLNPEILIVDEVLAVGDAEFQKKCLGKMQDVSRNQGRTVLFVSHNLNAISSLCKTVMVLNQGRLIFSGNVSEGLEKYASHNTLKVDAVDLSEQPHSPCSTQRLFCRLRMFNAAGEPSCYFRPLTEVTIELDLKSRGTLRGPKLSIGFNNWNGDRIFMVATFLGPHILPSFAGEKTAVVRFVLPPLLPGRYTLDLGAYEALYGVVEELDGVVALEVLEDGYLETTLKRAPWMGHVIVKSQWAVTTPVATQ